MKKGVGKRLQISRRNLPHIQAGGSAYFITWRILDGLSLTMPERLLTLEATRKFHGVRYLTSAVVVMPDHVHLLLTPLQKEPKFWWDLGALLKGMKGASARAINKQRNRTGSLWQDEAFDRIMRPGEFTEKYRYICLNAQRAGLVAPGEAYPALWISCFEDGWMPTRMAEPWQGPDDPRCSGV